MATAAPRLRELAGERLDRSIFLPGAVPRGELGSYFAAIDVASLPQSVDQVGSFRYTTKISEYLAAGLPIVTGQIPLAYDLDDGFLWRLPGDAPWDPALRRGAGAADEHASTRAEAAARRPAAAHARLFDADRQIRAVSAFVRDVVERERDATASQTSAAACGYAALQKRSRWSSSLNSCRPSALSVGHDL